MTLAFILKYLHYKLVVLIYNFIDEYKMQI